MYRNNINLFIFLLILISLVFTVSYSFRLYYYIFFSEIKFYRYIYNNLREVDKIMEKVKQNRHISNHDIGKKPNIDHKTVLNHGYKKFYVWVPHNLTVKNLMDRISICKSLLKRNKIKSFLKRLITCNEKWITYDNNVQKRSWSKQGKAPPMVAKSGLTPRKVMLCVWWDWKEIVHYELLPPGQTIDFTVNNGKDYVKQSRENNQT